MIKDKFTLIELLVVVAILGLLVSLLLPSLSNARLKTQQAVCLSNQHQLGLATISYTVDSNGYAPHNDGDPDDSGDDNNWPHKLLDGYISPSDLGRYGPSFKCPVGTKPDQFGKLSIAMNSQLTGGTNSVSSTPLIIGATASETVMFIDSYKWWIQASHAQMTNSKLIEDSIDNNIARHFFKANCTFLDGHGKAQSATFLLSKNDEADTFWDPEK
ncbi:MAG: prepilin-type N-terminal cleavage/methylation domain-containing protein [Lentisphaeraceae bacterium]|nr:prepilin-type N-terminal cleavage/methylation domain-containing protein [Lentisphaeraceae bacterium]